ncbi:MAG: hypothetical protein RJB58_39 [Pseudomonadota bacterium]
MKEPAKPPPLEEWQRQNLSNHFNFMYELARAGTIARVRP